MLSRSEISFIFLWVVNPILILCFQNCSHLPEGQTNTQAFAKMENAEPTDSRAPACTGMGHRCTQPF